MRLETALFLLLTLCMWVLAGCMAKRDYAYAPQEAYYDMDDEYYGGEMLMAEEARPMARKSRARSGGSSSSSSGAPPPAPSMQPGSPAPEPPADSAPAQEQPKAERMVHYDGWMQLRVTRVQDALDAAAKLAEDVGGKVERMSGGTITVAVPVARFESSFALLTELGDVMNKSITATDITDQFTSTELRLRTAETTRTRLQELLAKATEETEKLQLLREIARLTEQIDLMESQVELLASLASFSRITVEAVPRQAVGQGAQREEPWGLGWIQRLSPFRQDVVAAGKLLKLDVPEGFVALDIKKRFVAESADGVILRSGKLLNEPHGDTEFWLAAIQQRLEPEFASATVQTWGAYRVLTLVQGDDEPYVYIVAVSADDKWLQLIEVYYPGFQEQERHGGVIRGAIEGSAGVSQAAVFLDGRAG